MTLGFAWIAAGVPFGDLLAVVEHHDVVGQRHHHAHLVLDEASASRRSRTIRRISSARPSVSLGLTPPAGSSASSSFGSVASASAKATRLRCSCVMSQARRWPMVARGRRNRAPRPPWRGRRCSSARRRREAASTSRERRRACAADGRRRDCRRRSPSRTAFVAWKVRAMPSRAIGVRREAGDVATVRGRTLPGGRAAWRR